MKLTIIVFVFSLYITGCSISGTEESNQVDRQPEPIGGMDAIISNLHYPEIAKLAGIEGKINVLANIDEAGNVVKTEVEKKLGAGLDEAAMDAVKSVKFNPGMEKGKPVKTTIVIPIRFTL